MLKARELLDRNVFYEAKPEHIYLTLTQIWLTGLVHKAESEHNLL